MISGRAQRLVTAPSAEWGPVGSVSEKLETGTSGIAAKDELVMPFLMSVLPTRITRTPLPSRTMSRSGKAAPPCETRNAGPVRGVGSVGVTALAVPTLDSLEQPSAFAAKVASGQAFWMVVSREGSAIGSCVNTERMFAWFRGCVTFTCRLPPLRFEHRELHEALQDGVDR